MWTHSLKILQYLFFVSLAICITPNISSSQCSGTVILSTQAQVDAFDCGTFSGNLTITGADITSIDPLFTGAVALSSVTGDLTIRDCPNLKNLQGLDGLITIGNNLTIQNLPLVNGFGSFNPVNLKSIGNWFWIDNCPNLPSVPFTNLTSAGLGVFIWNASGITDFSGLNNLTSSPWVEFRNTNLSSVSGFNGISSCSNYSVVSNPNLKVLSGFPNLNTVSNLTVTNNPLLSECCILIPAINGNPPFMNISGNAFGCASPFQIDAPPTLTGCTPNNTINLTPGACTGAYEIANPIAADNCDLQSYSLKLTLGNGSIEYNGTATSGGTLTFNLEIGANTFEYTAKDANGNVTSCSTVITVYDNQAPIITNCPSSLTANVEPNNCVGVFNFNAPNLDDCLSATLNMAGYFADGTQAFSFPVTPGSNQNISDAPIGSYLIFTGEDINGNSSSCQMNFIVIDNVPPVISGVPGDQTINCNDDFPTIPSPSFSDVCDSNLDLAASSSIQVGDCSLGTPAEIHTYSWSATDDAGNTSEETWVLTVINDFSFELGEDVVICDGSPYIIDPPPNTGTYNWSTGETSSAITVNSSGTYVVTITTNNGCCFIDEITVTYEDPPDISAVGGMIGCGEESIILMGSSTTPNVEYFWLGPGGFASFEANPEVSNVGEYTLAVTTPLGCSSSTTVTVTADNDVPDASATGGTINCSSVSVQLMGESSTAGTTFSWTGPDGYTSSEQNPTVSTPGIYTFSATLGGCSGTADAEVVDDTNSPDLVLVSDIIDCNNPDVTINSSSSAAISAYNWSGPDGFSSSVQNPSVSSGGTYSVTVTGENDCTSIESIDIVTDLDVPDVTVSDDMLSCTVNSINLNAGSTTGGVDFSWSGPNGFTSIEQNPAVMEAGNYSLTVTGPNGCTSSASLEIMQDVNVPDLTISGGNLDCQNSSVELMSLSSFTDLTYSWTSPGGFSSSEANVTVTDESIYTLVVTSENGCSATASFEVENISEFPNVSLSAFDIGCNNPETQVSLNSDLEISAFSWSGPDGFTSDVAEPIFTQGGTYNLTVTATNGCTSESSIQIDEDFEEPQLFANGGTLTCTLNTVTLNASSNVEDVTFSWIGPDNFTSSEPNPVTSIPGEYTVSIVAPNGCTNSRTFTVPSEGDLPNISASGGNIDCNNVEAVLLGSTTTEGATVQWTGPDGFESTESNIIVTVPGTYTFTVFGPSGCNSIKIIEVLLDNVEPDVALAFGVIDCSAGSRKIDLETNALDPIFAWTGPGDFNSNEQNPSVSLAGEYTVFVTGSNGCTNATSITLENDINITAEVIVNGNSAEISISGGTGPFAIVWDNGSTELSTTDLSEGEHTVIVTDDLGCSQSFTFNVTPSSVEDLGNLINFNLFPNPAQHDISVSWKSELISVQMLNIVDLNGQRVHQVRGLNKNRNQVKIDISDLPQGVYFVELLLEDQVFLKKFLKM